MHSVCVGANPFCSFPSHTRVLSRTALRERLAIPGNEPSGESTAQSWTAATTASGARLGPLDVQNEMIVTEPLQFLLNRFRLVLPSE